MLKRTLRTNFTFNISLIYIGLMFFVPFINMHHHQPIPSFYSEWFAAILGLIAIFPFMLSTYWDSQANYNKSLTKQSGLQIPQVSLTFLGLAAILGVQWVLGMLQSNQNALLILSYFVWAFLLVVLGSYLRRSVGFEKLTLTLAWSLVVAGIVNICIVVLQFVERTGGFVAFLPKLLSYGALSQTNHFADFVSLAIASLIYLYVKGRFSKSFFYLILVLFMAMLSFSGSRSAWLYLTALTVLMTIWQANIKELVNEINDIDTLRSLCFLLIPLFIIVQLFIHFVIPNEFVKLPTERLLDGVTTRTASMRLQFWYDSLRIFFHSPWLGVGAGKLFTNTFLLLDTSTSLASKRVFEHAHNLFLHLLAEMGIGAFLIVLIGLFSWVKAFKWRDINFETWWVISLLSILGIHSMLEYPLWFSFFLGVTAILLGMGDEKILIINFSNAIKKSIRIFFILIWLLSAISLSTMLVANRRLENSIQNLSSENDVDMVAFDWIKQYSLLSPYSEIMRALSKNVDSKTINEDFLLNQSAMNYRPMRSVAYKNALLLKLKGENANAVKQLNRTLIAYPGTFRTFLENTPLPYKQEYLNLFTQVQLLNLNNSIDNQANK